VKKILIAFLVLLLTGCAAEDTMETVADELVQPVMAQPGEIFVNLPGEAAMPAMESDSGRMYLAGEYEIYIQTLSAGDLSSTIRSISGYERENLTVMHTCQDGTDRYEFVWTCAGENGDRLGRGVVLDDGNYHYVMTVLRDAQSTASSQISWNDVFASFSLV
jgi:hypothetical protein